MLQPFHNQLAEWQEIEGKLADSVAGGSGTETGGTFFLILLSIGV